MYWLIVKLLAVLSADPAAAQGCVYLESDSVYHGDLIVLDIDLDVDRQTIEAAIGAWQTCDVYGRGFPAFVLLEDLVPGQVGRRVRVETRKTGPGRRCGSFRGAEIVLYSFARDAHGQVVPCGSLAQNLAHELGHVLGLPHAPSMRRCKPRIMATLDNHNADRRRVTSEECRSVDSRWLTSAESSSDRWLPPLLVGLPDPRALIGARLEKP